VVAWGPGHQADGLGGAAPSVSAPSSQAVMM